MDEAASASATVLPLADPSVKRKNSWPVILWGSCLRSSLSSVVHTIGICVYIFCWFVLLYPILLRYVPVCPFCLWLVLWPNHPRIHCTTSFANWKDHDQDAGVLLAAHYVILGSEHLREVDHLFVGFQHCDLWEKNGCNRRVISESLLLLYPTLD